MKVCNEWCRKNNTAPNWDLLQELIVEHGMPDNPTFILEGKSLDNQPITIPSRARPEKSSRDTSQPSAAYIKYGPIIRAESIRKNNEWEIKVGPLEEAARKKAFFAEVFVKSQRGPSINIRGPRSTRDKNSRLPAVWDKTSRPWKLGICRKIW